VEHIDEEFALSRFGNKDGNLYKCLYPADLDYLGADPDSYKLMSGDRQVYELTTNIEEDDYSDLAAFIDVLENSPNDRLICDLEALFNTYDYLKIMAADIFCGDWDGYIYNKNNFYLYHNTATGKMEYIPYDVDNTFGIDWFNIDWAERNIYNWKRGGSEKRPLYDRLINNTELRQQFTFYAGQLITSTIDMDSLTQSIESRKNMIAPYVASDPYYPLDYGYDYGDFMLSYTNAMGAHVKYGLYPYLNARSLSMSQQLEAGKMAPVIKYIRHRRDPGQGIEVKAYAEAEVLPLNAMLIYTVDGGSNKQIGMNYDGSGIYSVTLEGIPDAAAVTYHIVVSDRDGRTNVKPCEPAMIIPVSGDTPLLFINEFMADNEKNVADDHGNYIDWIEIYNGDNEDVYLGDHHAGFKLAREGEEIGLYSKYLLVVDTLSFGEQSGDVSSGRKSNGAIEIVFFNVPTPGRSNNATQVEDTQAENRLIVYPNPAHGDKVRLNQKINCRIYNSWGTVVFTGNEVDEIYLQDYPSGLYVILTDDGRSVKFIVVRSQ
jgi:hypothetical protein